MAREFVQYLRDLSDELSMEGELNRYITVCIDHGEVEEVIDFVFHTESEFNGFFAKLFIHPMSHSVNVTIQYLNSDQS